VNEVEIRALRATLDAEHQKDLEAIDRVLKLLAERRITASRPLSAPSEVIAPVVADGEQSTLIDAVRRVFEDNPKDRWLVSTVEEQLRKHGFQFDAVKPRNSLHTALNRLQERGVVRVVKRGRGRKPSVYASVLPQEHQTGDDASLNGRH